MIISQSNVYKTELFSEHLFIKKKYLYSIFYYNACHCKNDMLSNSLIHLQTIKQFSQFLYQFYEYY